LRATINTANISVAAIPDSHPDCRAPLIQIVALYEFGRLWPQLIGDLAPLTAGGLGVVLGEGGGDEGRDDAPSTPGGMGENVAHEVDVMPTSA
jgi:hypothetical protein